MKSKEVIKIVVSLLLTVMFFLVACFIGDIVEGSRALFSMKIYVGSLINISVGCIFAIIWVIVTTVMD